MNKTQIIDAVAKETGLKKKEAEAAVNAVFTTIEGALTAGEKVQLVGFGTFKLQDRPERTGRNPATGDAITIPAAKVPKFVPSSAFKAAVNCCCKK